MTKRGAWPFAILALLTAGAFRDAGALETIQLLTGASGTPCAQDPNVLFTSTSVSTPQHAVVGTGAPGDPCAVRDDLHQGKSRCITTTNSFDYHATFTITFQLPAMYGSPHLSLHVKADDRASVSLNNHSLGSISSILNSVEDSSLPHFITGTNTLAFYVVNDHGSGSFQGDPREGPDDTMNLQFEGTVTYEPPPAGGGLNLGWNDCPSGPTYALLETFACDTNVGVHLLFGSFIPPPGINAMSANQVVIDVQSGGASFAPWWTFGTGLCRPSGSLQSVFDFTNGPFSCYDYWQGGAVGGFFYSGSPATANRARIKGVFALPAGDPRITSLPEGLEYYSFKLVINNAKSTGLGACPGCNDEACIVLNMIALNQTPPNPSFTPVTSPAVAAHVLWQGWSTPDPTNQCPTVTPARKQTWGSIKALYR